MEVAPGFVLEDDLPPERAIDGAGWKALGIGIALALATEVLPLLRVLVGHFVVLVHELGHAAAGWLLGYPSIPAFDFAYGGGVTTHREQMTLLVVAAYGLFGALAWIFRENRATLALVGALAAAYSATLLTSGAEVVMLAMGHGAELVFATVFLRRAVTGDACHHAAERPLYAWIGLHVVLHDLRFAWGLVTNPFQREIYEGAKGGGHWMDFSRLADAHLHVPLETVAAVFFGLCLLPPILALALAWLRPELAALRERLGEV